MTNIQLPDDQFQQLSKVAHAAGYQDVSAFIGSFANEPFDDPRGKLSEDQLRENVAFMERGEAELDAGGGHNLRDAIIEIATKYDLKIQS